MNIVIKKDFFEVFPNAKIGVIVCKNINNNTTDADFYRELLDKAKNNAIKYINQEVFTDNEVSKYWRNAYQNFKTKKGARSSIESLLKRLKNGNTINNINPLVDIYNYISLTYGVPCGSEDLDKIEVDLLLTKATGNEEFIPLGAEDNEPPYIGEIIYKDSIGAICRCLNWRESKRTLISEETKNAVLCLEIIDDTYLDNIKDAIEQMSQLIKEKLNAEVSSSILDVNNNIMTLI